jgi:Uma2 family endonuclease
MTAVREHPPARMTTAEFFAWNPEDISVRSWQLIDGEPVAMAPAADAHGAILVEIGSPSLWDCRTGEWAN